MQVGRPVRIRVAGTHGEHRLEPGPVKPGEVGRSTPTSGWSASPTPTPGRSARTSMPWCSSCRGARCRIASGWPDWSRPRGQEHAVALDDLTAGEPHPDCCGARELDPVDQGARPHGQVRPVPSGCEVGEGRTHPQPVSDVARQRTHADRTRSVVIGTSGCPAANARCRRRRAGADRARRAGCDAPAPVRFGRATRRRRRRHSPGHGSRAAARRTTNRGCPLRPSRRSPPATHAPGTRRWSPSSPPSGCPAATRWCDPSRPARRRSPSRDPSSGPRRPPRPAEAARRST